MKAHHAGTLWLILGIALGALAGMVMGKQAVIFKPLGDIFLNLLFTLVVPLVFFSISGAVSASSNVKRLGKLLGSMLVLFIGTGILASLLTIIALFLIQPCSDMTIPTIAYADSPPVNLDSDFSFSAYFVKMVTVPEFSQLLSQKNMLPLIVFSVFFGICVPLTGERGTKISQALNDIAAVIYKMIACLMKAAPVGLGAYFANMIGTMGSEFLGAFFQVVLFFFPVALTYFFFAFPMYCFFAGGWPCVKGFFKYSFTPAVTALSTSSSNAAIPVQRRFCDAMHVPPDISGIVLPMGATMHMDGGCIATITKIYLVCLLFQVPWGSLQVLALSIFLAVVASTAISSVPGGGAIGSVMIVSAFGLPPASLGILLLVGTLVDPLGTMINSTGDSVVSFLVARILEGKKWMSQ